MNKTLKKVINVIVDVLIILVLVISATVLVTVLTTNQGGKGVPNIFGKAPISVLTPSMQGDKSDSFNEGDLLFCDVIEAKSTNTFEEGDVVTFRADVNEDGNEDLVTHRIYKVNGDGTYYTKGDANVTYDQDPNAKPQFSTLYSENVLAVYHGSKIGGIGYVMSFLRTSQGFFFCILLPMILFFIYQAIRVIINAMAYSREKGKLAAEQAIANADLTEEQKAKAIAEYLAQQKEQLNEKAEEEASDAEEAAEASPADAEESEE